MEEEVDIGRALVAAPEIDTCRQSGGAPPGIDNTHIREKPTSEKNPQWRKAQNKQLEHPSERAGGQLRMKPAPGKSQKVKPRQDREKRGNLNWGGGPLVVVNQRYS